MIGIDHIVTSDGIRIMIDPATFVLVDTYSPQTGETEKVLEIDWQALSGTFEFQQAVTYALKVQL
jgi:hypothetical protein